MRKTLAVMLSALLLGATYYVVTAEQAALAGPAPGDVSSFYGH